MYEVLYLCMRFLFSVNRCAAPQIVAFATRSYESTDIGNNVSYTCKEGYEFDIGFEELNSTCTTDGWTSVPSACKSELNILLKRMLLCEEKCFFC